jgi:hypothetical protein
MLPMDDMALLREFARTGSESAFAVLADRYVGLVYPDCHLSDADWEFVSSGDRADLGHLDQTILFRERKPRQSPAGLSVRIYAFGDHDVAVFTLPPTMDFGAAETFRGYVTNRGTH